MAAYTPPDVAAKDLCDSPSARAGIADHQHVSSTRRINFLFPANIITLARSFLMSGLGAIGSNQLTTRFPRSRPLTPAMAQGVDDHPEHRQVLAAGRVIQEIAVKERGPVIKDKSQGA